MDWQEVDRQLFSWTGDRGLDMTCRVVSLGEEGTQGMRRSDLGIKRLAGGGQGGRNGKYALIRAGKKGKEG